MISGWLEYLWLGCGCLSGGVEMCVSGREMLKGATLGSWKLMFWVIHRLTAMLCTDLGFHGKHTMTKDNI